MIVNAQNGIEEILFELQKSPFHFHLTGSRFFGDCNPFSSDYDFFVQKSLEVIDFLRPLGFQLIDTAYDNDDQTINVMRHHKKGVDIQLVKNVDLKKRAQKAIKEKYLEQYLEMDKLQRRNLWDVLYYVFFQN